MKRRRKAVKEHWSGVGPLLRAGSKAPSDREREQWYEANTIHLDRIDQFTLLDDTMPAEWIGKRMHESSRGPLLWVPDGFEAYARVFFPYQFHELPEGYDEDPLSKQKDVKIWTESWSTIATRHGKVAHVLMKREAIDLGEESGDALDELDESGMRALTNVLRKHTSTPDETYVLVWEGYGNINQGWEQHPPQVMHPLQRGCYALKGPIDAVGHFPLKIQNWFPADRTWCYGSDTDLYWAFVAGSAELIDELTRTDGLEVLRLEPTDTVTFGYDPVNDPDGKIEIRW